RRLRARSASRRSTSRGSPGGRSPSSARRLGPSRALSRRRRSRARGRVCFSAYSPYNLRPVKSRQRTRVGASAPHQESSGQAVVGDPPSLQYPVTLVRDDGDRAEWTATVDALPGCNARGETPDQALHRVAVAAAAWVKAAE